MLVGAQSEATCQFYYETAKSNSSTKLTNEAIVIVQLYGSSPRDLTAKIESPNYPMPYPSLTVFDWLVKTKPTYQLEFTLNDFETEQCCDDLTVYDGTNYKAPVVSLVSTKHVSRSYIFSSSGNALLIKFKSDCSFSGRGFSGTVRVTEGPWQILRRSRRVEQIALWLIVENHGNTSQEVTVEIFLSKATEILSFSSSEEGDRKVSLNKTHPMKNLIMPRPVVFVGLFILNYVFCVCVGSFSFYQRLFAHTQLGILYK